MSEGRGYTETTYGLRPTELEPDQRNEAVWTSTILCANCRHAWDEHCKAHLIPCCPGRCPRETTDG